MSGTNTPTVDPLVLPDAAPVRFRPGDRVAGRYEVLRLLGAGGSAVVYAARDHNVGDEVALKILRPERRSEMHVERSRREAELARGSVSPRLVRTFDLDDDGALLFLTMELVPGGSLRDLLRRGPLPVEEVIRLAEEILEALADLHALKIVHRDLKPANLLLTAEGHVKLSDFGIARRWDDERARLTVTDMPVGTIAYLSPEQARCEDVDARTDLYAFGIVLYEMLTGSVPFDAPSAVGSLLLRFNQSAPDVRTLRADTPEWLATIVARLLQKERADRYESAEAVLRDLRRRSARRPRRRLRAMLIAAAAMMVIAATAWVIDYRFSFDRLAYEGDSGVRALSASGDTLWTRRDFGAKKAVLVRRGRFARRELATVLAQRSGSHPVEQVSVLSFLDPRTGRVLRTRELPHAADAFPQHARQFGPLQVLATDLDSDGSDEIAVTYVHTYYPSYIVVHNTGRDESHLVFVASGHHHVAAVEDIDGDGTDELIVAGHANRLGWYLALGAVSVRPNAAAHTPDQDSYDDESSLLWYTLAPRGILRPSMAVTVDRGSRLFRLHYTTREPYEVTFDGFARSSRSSLVAGERRRARTAAYGHVREAYRLVTTGLATEAVREAEAAESLARRAGDGPLTEWSVRVWGISLVAAGRLDEAERLFKVVNPADVWDAANAFHLAGALPRAVEWYRRNLRGPAEVGRMKYETVEGFVLALVEMERWDEALDVARSFEVAYPRDGGGGAWYRRYVEWRRGAVLPRLEPPLGDIALMRYWALETRLAAGASPEEIAAAAEREQVSVDAVRALVLSCRGEALRRMGREKEALEITRSAYRSLLLETGRDVIARAHFDIVVERLARLGSPEDAASARRELAKLRWRANGMQN